VTSSYNRVRFRVGKWRFAFPGGGFCRGCGGLRTAAAAAPTMPAATAVPARSASRERDATVVGTIRRNPETMATTYRSKRQPRTPTRAIGPRWSKAPLEHGPTGAWGCRRENRTSRSAAAIPVRDSRFFEKRSQSHLGIARCDGPICLGRCRGHGSAAAAQDGLDELPQQ